MTADRTCDLAPFTSPVVAQIATLDQAASAVEILVQSLENFLARFKMAVCEDLTQIVEECCGGGSGVPAEPDTSVQFNDDGNFGGDAAFVYDKTENQLTPGTKLLLQDVSTPAPPSSGRVKLFSAKIGPSQPSWLTSEGTFNQVGPSQATRHIFWFKPYVTQAAGGTVASIWVNGGTFAGTGTASFPARATTNVHTRSPAILRNTSATGNNSLAEWHGTQAHFYRGNAAGEGGFFFAVRFAQAATPSSMKMFFGLQVALTSPAATVEPSAFVSCIGVGCDSAGTTLNILHNDGAGGAASIPLGADFPSRDTATIYDFFLYAHPAGGDVDYYIINRGSGAVASGTISSDLPAATSFLAPLLWSTNGAAAGGVAVVMDLGRVYAELFD